ncbi:MAG: hypothetical protein CMJ81_20665 [Planctomycetaceae bacterium]|nr:hypothetical protein [Planctomycetaceae bacterium]MBP62454.1 hypothetical protein [Planctomycetaceae bacterium]
MGLVAFATTLAQGLIHRGHVDSTLATASVSLFTFTAAGLVVGHIAELAIEDSLKSRMRTLRGPEKTAKDD